MYVLKILTRAQKDLDQLHGKIFNNVKIRIIQLANNPRPYGTIKLTNEDGYRLRIGDYRVLYRVDDKSKEVFIYRVKHRREVYR
jgi:mRNA interferase RelE/StbE